MRRSITLAAGLLAALVLGLAGQGCDRSSPSTGTGRFSVVAAENFWGSIARQLAGSRASVQSVIVNPNTDPHSYEPNARDARAIAGARLVITNGIGYDGWASRLLAASPSAARVELNIGDLLGLHEGENPHQWYSPDRLAQVIDRIVADYDAIDPAGRSYFAARRRLLSGSLGRYYELVREIRRRYAGVPVGYSESIFQPLGEDLHLKLLTPAGFARAVAEGTDVTAGERQEVQAQVSERRIEVWVFNSQNVTPDVQRINQLARERHIPIVTVTETLAPPSASFQQWQSSELEGLRRALHVATGR